MEYRLLMLLSVCILIMGACELAVEMGVGSRRVVLSALEQRERKQAACATNETVVSVSAARSRGSRRVVEREVAQL